MLHNVTILVDRAGWPLKDKFNGGRPAASSPEDYYAADPDEELNSVPRLHIPDSQRAKAWRQRLFDSLMRKLNLA